MPLPADADVLPPLTVHFSSNLAAVLSINLRARTSGRGKILYPKSEEERLMNGRTFSRLTERAQDCVGGTFFG